MGRLAAPPLGCMNSLARCDLTLRILGNPAASNAVTACSYLFVASFAVSYGPVSWVYPAEIFSANVRAKAVSMATSTNWAFNFALAYAVPPMLNSIKYKTYFIFGTFNAVAAIHLFFTAHETKKRYSHSARDQF